MSLPVHLSSKVKEIPMDPLALANDLELAYMLSFSPYSNPYPHSRCFQLVCLL